MYRRILLSAGLAATVLATSALPAYGWWWGSGTGPINFGNEATCRYDSTGRLLKFIVHPPEIRGLSDAPQRAAWRFQIRNGHGWSDPIVFKSPWYSDTVTNSVVSQNLKSRVFYPPRHGAATNAWYVTFAVTWYDPQDPTLGVGRVTGRYSWMLVKDPTKSFMMSLDGDACSFDESLDAPYVGG